ncbi:unnamed protein product, partial [Ectocarpus sp. 13 AM-2016]
QRGVEAELLGSAGRDAQRGHARTPTQVCTTSVSVSSSDASLLYVQQHRQAVCRRRKKTVFMLLLMTMPSFLFSLARSSVPLVERASKRILPSSSADFFSVLCR